MDIDPQALWRGLGLSADTRVDAYLEGVIDDAQGAYDEREGRGVFTSAASHLRISVYIETAGGEVSIAFGIPHPRGGMMENLSIHRIEACTDGFLGIVEGSTERGVRFSFYDPFFFLHPEAYQVGAPTRVSLSALGIGWGRIPETELPPPLTRNSAVILPTDWNPAVIRFFGPCPNQLPTVQIRRWNLALARYSLYLPSLPGPVSPALDIFLPVSPEERPASAPSAIQGHAVVFGSPVETPTGASAPPKR